MSIVHMPSRTREYLTFLRKLPRIISVSSSRVRRGRLLFRRRRRRRPLGRHLSVAWMMVVRALMPLSWQKSISFIDHCITLPIIAISYARFEGWVVRGENDRGAAGQEAE